MNSSEYSEISTPALVDSYRQAATQHGKSIEMGDHQVANRAADRVSTIYAELRRRGLEAQRQLLPLLEDTNLRVRGWAAAHALEFAKEKGESVLTKLALQPGLLGFSAQMTLTEWREGRLQFP